MASRRSIMGMSMTTILLIAAAILFFTPWGKKIVNQFKGLNPDGSPKK